MRRPGEVLSRFQLLEHAWDYEYENRSNIVDSYVRLLRARSTGPFGVESIETVRGAGYRLRKDGGRVSRRADPAPGDPGLHGGHGLVLVAVGLFLYFRLEAQLDNRSTTGSARAPVRSPPWLASRRAELGGPHRTSLIEQDESFAQVLTAQGRLIDSTPQLASQPVLNRVPAGSGRGCADLRRARRPAGDRRRPRACSRPRSRPRSGTAGRRGRLLARRSQRGARQPRDPAADRRARGAAARLAGGIRRRGGGAAAGRGDAPASSGDLGRAGRRSGCRYRRRRTSCGGSAQTLNEMLRGSRRRWSASARSSTTRATSCARRWRCTRARLELALRHGESRRRSSGPRSPPGSRRSTAWSSSPRICSSSPAPRRAGSRCRPSRSRSPSCCPPPPSASGPGGGVRVDRWSSTATDLTVEGDRVRLEQALTNMVDNACATATARSDIWADGNGDRVEAARQRRGCRASRRVPRPGVRALQPRRPARAASGTGLGLAIVETIAVAHGGRAEAAKDPQAGRGRLDRDPGRLIAAERSLGSRLFHLASVQVARSTNQLIRRDPMKQAEPRRPSSGPRPWLSPPAARRSRAQPEAAMLETPDHRGRRSKGECRGARRPAAARSATLRWATRRATTRSRSPRSTEARPTSSSIATSTWSARRPTGESRHG